jgi:hypothetical protein
MDLFQRKAYRDLPKREFDAPRSDAAIRLLFIELRVISLPFISIRTSASKRGFDQSPSGGKISITGREKPNTMQMV